MKTKLLLIGWMTATPLVWAEPPTTAPAPPPLTPPPVVKVPAPTPGQAVDFVVLADGTPPVVKLPAPTPAQGKYIYDQKPVAGRPMLVTPDQAKTIVERFKAAYPKLGNPRFVIFVNRQLIDDQSGMKLSARREKTTSVQRADDTGRVTRREETASGDNTYRFRDPKAFTLADQQTVRDVERLFGRPLRLAGASLADQDVAAELMGSSIPKDLRLSTDSDQARKEREALAKVADVALEILISSRNVTAPGLSGDQTYAVPDIQATAIRLSDARILGQATASDLVGKGQYAAWVAQHFDVHDIAEATALSLMEDMMVGLNPEAAVDKK